MELPGNNVLQCRMYWLYVNPEMRGRGLARLLIQRSLDEATIRGKTSIRIGVWSSDTAAELCWNLGDEPGQAAV